MSEEHKALGYRPPPGSLAAEAQAAAAKHPDLPPCGISAEQIRLAALADAERIKREREAQTSPVSAAAGVHIDLDNLGEGTYLSVFVDIMSLG